MASLERAIALAATFHEGQTDKGGNKYILHPIRLMMRMKTEKQQIIAVLHDIVEDTDLSLEDLHQEGFADDVVEAVDALTRREDEIYMDFIRRIKGNELAREVKIEDIKDNMDLSRISDPTEQDYSRLKRYKKALDELEGKDCSNELD